MGSNCDLCGPKVPGAVRRAITADRRGLGGSACLPLVAVLAVLVGFHGLPQARGGDSADSGLAMLQAVCQQQGALILHSGELRYELHSVRPNPSEDRIRQVVDAGARVLRDDIARTKDESRLAELRAAIDSLESDFRAQMVANTRVRGRFFFAFVGPSLGGDRVIEATLQNADAAPAEFDAVYRMSGITDHILLRLDRQRATAYVEERPYFYGTQEPQAFGRLVGRARSCSLRSEGGDGETYRIHGISVREADSFQGHAAMQVVVSFRENGEDGSAFETVVTTVPSLGYITPMVRDLGPQGEVVQEWVSSNYVPVSVPAADPIWFPLVVEYRAGGVDPVEEKYTFDGDGIRLNQEVPHERFTVSLTPSIRVSDNRLATPVVYQPIQPLAIGLEDIGSLESNSALERIDIHPLGGSDVGPPSPRWPRAILINGCIVAAIVGALCWRRWRVTALVLAIICLSGCGDVKHEVMSASHAADDPLVCVTPAVIEFGAVSSSSDVVRKTMLIENRSAGPRHVSIEASCGCLVMDPRDLELDAGAKSTVSAFLFPGGRSGLRRSHVTIKSAGRPDSGGRGGGARETSQSIVATATITNEWTAVPRRMMISKTAERVFGTVAITAPRSEWLRATVGFIGGDVVWEETSRAAAEAADNEVRIFRVEVLGDGGGDRGLTVTLQGHESPVLVVPIVVSH